MKREIKFRGKTIPYKEKDFEYLGEWVYGFYHKNYKCECFIIEKSETGIMLPGKQVIPESISQFTVLLDKNGKEVFESDFVEIIHPCWTATCVTKYFDGAFWFIEKDNPINNSQIRADKFLKQGWEIKVIGNVFDNPELIKTI